MTEEKIVLLKTTLDELAIEIGVEKSAAYASGFSDGKVSMGSVEDKIYSQVEVDGMISPLKSEIEGLKLSVASQGEEISALKSEIEILSGDIAPKVDAAVSANTLVMKEKFAAFIASEDADEKAFLESLDPVAVEPAPVEEVPSGEIPASEVSV